MNEGKPAKANWWSRSREDEQPESEAEPLPGPGPAEPDARSEAPADSVTVEVAAGTDSGGDFELPPPVAPGPPAPAAPPVPEPAEAADSGPAVEAGPRSLHDPDPYSTPPYGHPGPWAPAPPVQHPAMAPAHGAAVPEPQTPADSPGPWAPAPPVQHPAMAPAHGTAVPEPQTPADSPDPWRRYDPWAPVGPLQQNGAGTAAGPPGTRKRGLLVGALVIALLSGGVGGVVGSYLQRHQGDSDRIRLSQTGKDETVGRAPDSVAGIAARALPSVVTLRVRGAGAEGTGTGFVLDGRGHILTNNHVVEPAGADGKVTVTFSGGESAEAEIVGRDTGYDLAVVKVSGVDGLRPVVLGNSDNVAVGDPVVAIGAPFDLANTVTSGIISAKERPITAGGDSGDGSDVSYVDALQTDASINPGNSGGPLLDARARVVGINSAIRSAGSGSGSAGAQAGSIGLGFAIPINQGKRVAEELINTGRATHPIIGVTLDMDYNGDGARVGTNGEDGGPSVTTGGPGDRAGLEAGDVITEVDGRRVHSGEELIVKIRAHRPGDRLELSLLRGGRQRTVSLVLGSSGGN
ncbi:trypsin-like peptidase domain-containing protein [Streptomyces sp. NPDC047042]|uniref:trypsin-like peptidase domain-containing protein n=1 Tax=Streptomyces sp. NPDC047042 TaxID=3154807 RepID=UPI0033CFE650